MLLSVAYCSYPPPQVLTQESEKLAILSIPQILLRFHLLWGMLDSLRG